MTFLNSYLGEVTIGKCIFMKMSPSSMTQVRLTCLHSFQKSCYSCTDTIIGLFSSCMENTSDACPSSASHCVHVGRGAHKLQLIMPHLAFKGSMSCFSCNFLLPALSL